MCACARTLENIFTLAYQNVCERGNDTPGRFPFQTPHSPPFLTLVLLKHVPNMLFTVGGARQFSRLTFNQLLKLDLSIDFQLFDPFASMGAMDHFVY